MLPEFTIIMLKLPNNSLVLANFKNVIVIGVGKPDLREGQVEKYGQNWKNAQFQQVVEGLSNLSLKHTNT